MRVERNMQEQYDRATDNVGIYGFQGMMQVLLKVSASSKGVALGL